MSSRFRFADTELAGLRVVERIRLGDDRGYLARLFCSSEMAAVGWVDPVAQINHTYTSDAGTVRGMHFQNPPHAEDKLVVCLRGRVFDVAVDLRAGSRTLLRWHGAELSAENGRALLIPRGFAHGFQALTADVEMLYVHSARFEREAEGGIHPSDPAVGIAWPLPLKKLSERDQRHPPVQPDFTGILL